MNERLEKITNKKIHHLFCRGLAHFDNYLGKILDSYERQEKFFLYTDFVPLRNSLTLDDVNRFSLLKWLQEVFNVPIIIQVKDNHILAREEVNILNVGDKKEALKIINEKHNLNPKQLKSFINSVADKQGVVKEQFRIEVTQMISRDCIRDIISLGLNRDLTFICQHLEYFGNEQAYVRCVVESGSTISLGHAQQFYNLSFSDSIQAISLAAKDVAAYFSASYPRIFDGATNIRALVVPGTSPFIKKSPSELALSVAPLLHYPSPSTVSIKAVPALCSVLTAMSSLQPLNCIYLSDSDKSIKDKINKVAFSGGKDSVEEHRRLGGNCDVDVSFQYLRFFLEDDAKLEDIRLSYSRGEMLTGELKRLTIEVLTAVVAAARVERQRADIEEEVCQWMRARALGEGLAVTGVVYDEVLVSHDVEYDDNDTEDKETAPEGDVVTPWEVVGDVDTGIDYDKLIDRYGSSKVTEELVARFEAVTGVRAHHFLRRGVFYSHRDMHELLDSVERGERVFLYTGRGPSSEALHLGHMVPFMFTQWLQEVLGAPLVVQLTDDEKFLYRGIDIDEVQRLAVENAKDIIAMGFDEQRTFVFRDLEFLGSGRAFYETALRVGSRVTFNQVRGIFGFSRADSVEKVVFPATQAAPSFSAAFPEAFPGAAVPLRCLIPCAIDQDPYFRMTRDVAPRLGLPKPALVHSRFFPALQGPRTKMNASDPSSAIFMTDDAAAVSRKVLSHAHALSREERAALDGEQRLLRDTCFQYLRFFMEDEEGLARVQAGLLDDSLSPDDLKLELVAVLTAIVEKHATSRAVVSDEVVRRFMTPRPLL